MKTSSAFVLLLGITGTAFANPRMRMMPPEGGSSALARRTPAPAATGGTHLARQLGGCPSGTGFSLPGGNPADPNCGGKTAGDCSFGVSQHRSQPTNQNTSFIMVLQMESGCTWSLTV